MATAQGTTVDALLGKRFVFIAKPVNAAFTSRFLVSLHQPHRNK